MIDKFQSELLEKAKLTTHWIKTLDGSVKEFTISQVRFPYIWVTLVGSLSIGSRLGIEHSNKLLNGEYQRPRKS